MEGTTLDLSKRSLAQITDIQDMLTQCAGGIEMLNLSGNYLKYDNIILNFLTIIIIEISIFKYNFLI